MLLGGSVTWAAGLSAAAAALSALALVIGGVIGYRKFLLEAPHHSRADLSIAAELFTWHDVDLLRIHVSIKAIGHVSLKLLGGDHEPYVAVQRLGPDKLDGPYPREWLEICAAAPVLIGQFVESGETLDDVVLLPIGSRAPDTLAYRVLFSVTVLDPYVNNEPFHWNAVTFVPVSLEGTSTHADVSTSQLSGR